MDDPTDFYLVLIGLSALGLVILFMITKLTILYCRGYRQSDYESI